MRTFCAYTLLVLAVGACCALSGGCAGHQHAGAVLPFADMAVPLPEMHLDATAPEGVDAALWLQLQSALTSALAQQRQAAALQLPLGEDSRVDDFAVAPDGTGQAWAYWTYCNPGDYNQNGVVDAGDLAPLGLCFGMTEDAAEWERASIADGNSDGSISLADVVTIAVNFGHAIAWYALEEAAAADATEWTVVQQVPLTAGVKRADGRLEYRAALPAQPGRAYRAVPCLPGNAEPGLPSNARVYFGGTSGAGAWPMPGGDAQRSSFSATPGPAQPRVLPLMDAQTGHRIDGFALPVLMRDGSIIATGYSDLRAYGRDGVQRWSWDDHPSAYCLRNTCVSGDGTVLCSCIRTDSHANTDDTYEVLCLGGEGRLHWRAETPAEVQALLPVHGRIYARTGSGLSCFSDAGDLLWAKVFTNDGDSALAAGSDGSVYCTDGQVLLKYGPAGELAWSAQLPAQLSAGLVVRRDDVVLVPTESKLLAFDGNGARLWQEYQQPGHVQALAVAHTNVSVALARVDTDGALALFAISPEGVLLNRRELGIHSEYTSLVLDSADRVYIHAESLGLYCLNIDGAEIYHYVTFHPRGAGSPLAIGSDGSLYFVEESWLFCLAPDGAPPLPAPYLAVSDAVYVDHIQLQWSAVTGAKKYRVYRDGNPIPLVETEKLEYADYSVLWPGSHSYSVCALNSLGKGMPSGSLSGRLKPVTMAPAGAGEWAVSGHDAQRSFCSSCTGTLQGQLLWTYDGEGYYPRAPVFASDGTLYLSSTYGRIEALTPGGVRKWRLSLRSYLGRIAVGPDGTLYFGITDDLDDNGQTPPDADGIDPYWEGEPETEAAAIIALAPDRTLRWRYELPADDAEGLPYVLIGNDGTVYATVGKSSLIKLTGDGNLLASTTSEVEHWCGTPLSISPAGDVYSLGYVHPTRELQQYDSGLQRGWSYTFTSIPGDTEILPLSAPLIGPDGRLYVTGDATGSATPGGLFITLGPGSDSWPLAMAPGGRVYVAGDPASASGLNRGIGYFSPAGEGHTIDATLRVASNFALDVQGKVYFLSITDGEKLYANCIGPDDTWVWQVELPVDATSGQIALGDDGTLYAVVVDTLFALGTP